MPYFDLKNRLKNSLNSVKTLLLEITCFWAEKPFEFANLSEKFASISAKTFFLEITCFWAEKPFEFAILAEKSASIHLFFFWRSPGFGLRNRLNFRLRPKFLGRNKENSSQGRLQFSHSFKTAPLFQILATCLKREGGMLQFCILFRANYTILATQREAHGPMLSPLNTPLYACKHVPVRKVMYCTVVNQSFEVSKNCDVGIIGNVLLLFKEAFRLEVFMLDFFSKNLADLGPYDRNFLARINNKNFLRGANE